MYSIPTYRWKSGARLYLDTATQFLASCQATGDINRAALDALDDARRRLDEHDRHYNAALDKLEVIACNRGEL
jgi:hypothetical protein